MGVYVDNGPGFSARGKQFEQISMRLHLISIVRKNELFNRMAVPCPKEDEYELQTTMVREYPC